MGLFSFLQRKKTPAPEARKRTPPPQDPVTVETLRTRARRRLIGAAVLVGGAVLGLPALFDKPPRPADQSFKVRLAGGEGAAAVSVKAPTPTTAGQAGSTAPTAAGLPSGSAVALAATGAVVAAAVLPGTARKPPADETIITEPKTDPKAEAMARAAADKLKADKARAEKLKAEKARQAEQAREAEKADKAREVRLTAKKAKDAKEAQDARASARKDKDARDAKAVKLAKAKANADDESDKPRRYVIQSGSFAEAAAARDLGRRIGKIGLDSHEQHVETAAGSARTRVRLGPFNSKEEALRAAAKLKAAGLNAAVLPL
jgi:DedD protein